MHNPTNNISAKEARNLVNLGKPIRDMSVNGLLNIEIDSCEWEKEVIIENCVVESLTCINTMFHKQIIIRNSQLKDAKFNFSYFYGGLIIDNCNFDKYLDFEAGGHNNPSNPIIIKNNEFREFVNFCDCWFTGKVEIKNNKFFKGTNIASKDQYLTFDMMPVFQDNVGQLDIESECREEEQ